MNYTIWHDNDIDMVQWLVSNTCLDQKLKNGVNITVKSLPKSVSNREQLKDAINLNPEIIAILPLLRYDKPDIIIQETDSFKCILAIEFMTQTPQSQHTKQRFGRVVASAMSKVPFAFIVPTRKMKLEKYGTVWRLYKCTTDLHEACLQLTRKFGPESLVFEWPDDGEGYIQFDEKHPTAPRIVNEISILLKWLTALVDGNEKSLIDITSKHKKHMKAKRTVPNPDPKKSEYGTIGGKRETVNIPASGISPGLMKTANLLKVTNLTSNVPAWFKSREETLIFSTKGFKDSKNPLRTDPYAGMIAMFHILYCIGDNGQRIRNLCCVFQEVSDDAWKKYIANLPSHQAKDCPFENSRVDIKKALKHIDECIYASGKRSAMYCTIPDLVLQTKGDEVVAHRFRG